MHSGCLTIAHFYLRSFYILCDSFSFSCSFCSQCLWLPKYRVKHLNGFMFITRTVQFRRFISLHFLIAFLLFSAHLKCKMLLTAWRTATTMNGCIRIRWSAYSPNNTFLTRLSFISTFPTLFSLYPFIVPTRTIHSLHQFRPSTFINCNTIIRGYRSCSCHSTSLLILSRFSYILLKCFKVLFSFWYRTVRM